MTTTRMTAHRISTLLILVLIFVAASVTARAQATAAQAPPTDRSAQESVRGEGIALSPARFELEMRPGSETTVVVNLDYRTAKGKATQSRIVASLNDWTMTKEGQLEFYQAGTQPKSASPWLIYSPSEVTVLPGNVHSIRVTISVPKEAAPGDHLSALIVEPRPDNLKLDPTRRQMLVRLRMAAVFYIQVPQLTRRGTLHHLKAEASPDRIIVTPTLKNEGNSLVRPISWLKIIDSAGRVVAELPQNETLPVLAGSELSQPIVIDKKLSPGTYSVKYRVDFQTGGKAIEGITDLVITENAPPPKPDTTIIGY